MTIGKERRGIGVFPHQQDAEAALDELRETGFPMDKVSVIAKKEDGHESVEGTDLSKKASHPVDKGAKIGSITGTTIGILTGILAGMSTVIVPGVGPVILAGSLAEAFAVTLASAGAGAVSGGVVGMLAALGIPEERGKVYSDLLARGDYLIVIEGKSDELMRAEMILLNDRGIKEWSIYDAHQEVPAPEKQKEKQKTPE
jgi:hypothetical protein